MLLIVIAEEVPFFSVTLLAALVVPMTMLPKERLVGVALTCACRPRGDATTAAAKTKAGRKWRPGIRDELLQHENLRCFLVGIVIYRADCQCRSQHQIGRWRSRVH